MAMTDALAAALLHFLWQGPLLGLIAVVVSRRFSHRADARYAVGIGTLAAMGLAPVVTTMWMLESAAAASVSTIVGRAPLPTFWVLAVWATGASLLACRMAGGWITARRLTHEAIGSAGADIETTARTIAQRLGVTASVRVLRSSAIAVPVMIGWLSPVVLLPASMLSGLSMSHIEALLAHEIAHIRRHDYLVNLLQSALEALLFFHPAVWWVSRNVREAREQCCDDLAVGVCDRLTYVSTLSTIAAARRPAPVVAANGGSLRVRVERLLRGTPTPRPSAGWMAVLPIAVVLAAAMPVAGPSDDDSRPAEARVADPHVADGPSSASSVDPEVAPRRNGPISLPAISTAHRRVSVPPSSIRPALPVVLDFLMPSVQAHELHKPPAEERSVASGDVLRLAFMGLSPEDLNDMNGDYTVLATGTIPVKFLGNVPVSGRPLRAIQSAILDGLMPKFYQQDVVALHVSLIPTAKAPENPAVLQEPVKATPAPQTPAPPKPGDVVRIEVPGQPALSGEWIVQPDGSLKRKTADPPVAKEPAYVYISGHVNSPGKKVWEEGFTVTDALTVAGGMTVRGRFGHIIRPVRNPNGTVQKYEKIKALKPETRLLPGDELVILQKWIGELQ